MSDVHNISDGDITIDFANPDSGYVLVAEGHRPAVAQEDPNRPERTLPVNEEFRLFIDGDDPADAASMLEDLTEIVHRAARLWRGEAVDPVIYQYQIANSTLSAPLEDLVIGAPENSSILELPSGYDSATMTRKIGSATDPIIWKLRRRGDWLDEEETDTATASEVGTEQACTLAGEIAGPIDINIEFSTASGTITDRTYEPFYFIMTNGQLGAEGMLLTQPGHGGVTSWFSVVSDSGNHAKGGTVLRYTPTGAFEPILPGTISGTAINGARLIHVFAAVYNSSAVADYYVRGVGIAYFQNEFNELVYTPWYKVSAGDNSRQIIYLGLLSMPSDGAFTLEYQASAANGYFDTDDLILVDANKAAIISVFGRNVDSTYAIDDYDFNISHRWLTNRQPYAGLIYRASAAATNYAGMGRGGHNGVAAINMGGDTLTALLLATDETSNYWRWRESGSSNIVKYAVTASRRPAYRVPR